MSSSPRDLPRIVRQLVEPADVTSFLAEATPLDVHFALGMPIRNAIRQHAEGWTDIELDERWPAVLEAALRPVVAHA